MLQLKIGFHNWEALKTPDAAESLAEIPAAIDERDAEIMLVDVVLVVGWGQHLALVDEVDA